MSEPKWWEWVEENWHDLVDWVKAYIDPTQPSPPAPPGPPTPPPPGPPIPTTTGVFAWMIDSSASGLVTDADLAAFVKASNADLATTQVLWPHVGTWEHVAVASGDQPPAGAIVGTLVDTLPEATNALAYHSVDNNGAAFIRVGVKVCQDNGVAWQSAADHETKETEVDAPCTLTATDPATGWVWALEVSDPVESSSYQVDGVTLSDLVGPSFFEAGVGALDKTGDATAPFTISPGGYAVIDKNDGQGPQSIFGEKFPEFRKRHVEALGKMGTRRRPKQ